MKNYSRYSFFMLLLLPAFAFSQSKQLTIRIGQDKSVVLDEYESRVTFNKKNFKIQVLLNNISGVYCYASLSDSIYKLASNDSIPGFEDLPGMTMAEEKFNDEKELMISNKGWSYWFYDPSLDWHRFNKKIVLLDDGRLVATKSIKQIYLVDQKKEIKLKDNNSPLYLFFVAIAETDSTGKPIKELLRRKIKIDWTNDD